MSTISKIKDRVEERLKLVKTWDPRTSPVIRMEELLVVLKIIEEEEG